MGKHGDQYYVAWIVRERQRRGIQKTILLDGLRKWHGTYNGDPLRTESTGMCLDTCTRHKILNVLVST